MSLVKWKKDNGLFPSLNSMFDNFFNDDNRFAGNWNNGNRLPAVNVKDAADTFSLELAAPGMKKEDFKIEVDKGVLTISSETENSEEETRDNYTRKEFSYSSFSRSFWLPENVTDDEIKAAYKDGLLTLTIPKKEEVKSESKKIEIA